MKIKSSMIMLVFAALAVNLHAASKALPAPLPEFMNQQQLATWNAEHASARQSVALAQEDSTQFYTGKPYVADAGGYVYKYRTYNPEMSRWTSTDPSGFPDGVNNLAYDAVPTSEMDDNGLETVPGSGSTNLSLTSKIHLPSDWTDLSASPQELLQSALGTSPYSITSSITYNTSSGTWGDAPTAPTLIADNQGSAVNFTASLGSSTNVSGTYTLSSVRVSVDATRPPTEIAHTDYVPGTADTSAKPATITYAFHFQANFSETMTLTGSNEKEDPNPEENIGDIDITFTE